jgi:hypothetical protein
MCTHRNIGIFVVTTRAGKSVLYQLYISKPWRNATQQIVALGFPKPDVVQVRLRTTPVGDRCIFDISKESSNLLELRLQASCPIAMEERLRGFQILSWGISADE